LQKEGKQRQASTAKQEENADTHTHARMFVRALNAWRTRRVHTADTHLAAAHQDDSQTRHLDVVCVWAQTQEAHKTRGRCQCGQLCLSLWLRVGLRPHTFPVFAFICATFSVTSLRTVSAMALPSMTRALAPEGERGKDVTGRSQTALFSRRPVTRSQGEKHAPAATTGVDVMAAAARTASPDMARRRGEWQGAGAGEQVHLGVLCW
jgi:hypothetical protein